MLRLQDDPQVDLLACLSCRGYSASRMPTSEALRSYYSNYYEDADERVTFDLPQRLARHIFKRAFSSVPRRTVHVLDFGGGDAGIARAVGKILLDNGADGVRVHLVDFNAELKPNAAGILVDRSENLDGVGDREFDLVIASAILEHIPRPMPDLTRLLAVLRKGGVFYARTPSVVPILRLMRSFGVRTDFTFPAHLHDLGEKFWSGVLDRLRLRNSMDVLESRPALVETTFSIHPLRTAAAYLLKAPWQVLGPAWRLTGGWEVFFKRREIS